MYLTANAAGQIIIFVDSAVPVSGDGSSWSTAYKELDDALFANTGPGVQFWVKGTHSPFYQPFGVLGMRSYGLPVRDGQAIFGGFNGTETSLDQRDWAANVTYIDSARNAFIADDDSYRAFQADGADVLIDGLVIDCGRADGDPGDRLDTGSRMLLENGASAVIQNCVFMSGFAHGNGGAIAVLDDSLIEINDCTFVNTNCTGVNGGDGGAIYLDSVLGAEIYRCSFFGCTASGSGGAVFSESDIVHLESSQISGCSADVHGGAIALGVDAEIEVISSTLASNTAGGLGGGVYMPAPMLGTVYLIAHNSVLWGNSSSEGAGQNGQFSVQDAMEITYCVIQGIFIGGTGNTGSNPLFVDADGPDNVLGTTDDDLTPGIGSSAIDAGSNSAWDSWGSSDTDVLGNPRFVDDDATPDIGEGSAPIIDIGAVEFLPCPADFDGDRDADGIDVGIFLSLYAQGDLRADLNDDGFVNGIDVGLFLQAYAMGC